MGQTLEQQLADYLLSLVKGSWSNQYNQECFAMWRERYGERIALRIEAIVKERWGK